MYLAEFNTLLNKNLEETEKNFFIRYRVLKISLQQTIYLMVNMKKSSFRDDMKNYSIMIDFYSNNWSFQLV